MMPLNFCAKHYVPVTALLLERARLNMQDLPYLLTLTHCLSPTHFLCIIHINTNQSKSTYPFTFFSSAPRLKHRDRATVCAYLYSEYLNVCMSFYAWLRHIYSMVSTFSFVYLFLFLLPFLQSVFFPCYISPAISYSVIGRGKGDFGKHVIPRPASYS